MGKRGPTGEKKKWLAVARDDKAGGSHILLVEAETHKTAYEECTHQCIMHNLRVPEQRAVYELPEDISEGGTHICTVLDATNRGGLFNGRTPISISPKSGNSRSWSGAVLRS